METDRGSFEVGKDDGELHENHMDPSRINKKMEDKLIAESVQKFEEQNKIEEAARAKKLNDLIDKGLNK
ncbi:hypothetical protein FO488_05050 [Geobacter sp. FeAm09]|uniref:hypothetical protein n=1 Tax=Geobacter sp. FeAm09 TaxID=2597769 RepID=UPI0011EDFF9E|nr:hypothetical protein [Geobacter sp. FeAm09]QEM67580.1 hypothetical protein FO488_05050 [Geobacter sp. FeAm09]